MKITEKMRHTRLRVLLQEFPQVKYICDSGSRVNIAVLDRDQAEGQPNAATECALARASKRQLRMDGALIRIGFSYLVKGNKAIRFKTPDSVAREITSFDRHHDFAPGNYHLSKVSEAAKLGQGKHGHNTGTGPRQRSEHRNLNHRTVRVREWDA